MAPYVEREWGAKATELMWRVKRLADPDGLLAPGVVLNRDPGVHLRNLKSTPPIEEVADTCVECGFCEPVCPSRLLTTTPRQRIALRREMARQPPVAASARRCWTSTSTTRSRPAPPTAAACSPARSGSTRASSSRGSGRPSTAPRAERLALAGAKRWRTVERSARGGLRVGGAIRPRRSGTRRSRARPRAPPAHRRPGAGPGVGAGDAEGGASPRFRRRRARGRRRSTSPRASTGSSASRAPSRTATSLPEALVRASRAGGAPGMDPARRRRLTAAARPGPRRATPTGTRWMANGIVERLWRLDRMRASCRWSSTRARAPTGSARRGPPGAERRQPRAPRPSSR